MGAPTIVQTATAVPAHVLSQQSVKELCEQMPLPAGRRPLVMALFDHAQVETRSCVMPFEQLRERRSLSETMAVYRQHAVRLGLEVVERCLADARVPARAVDLLITVSCTGIMIPSLDAHLANRIDFRPDIKRLPITELGCVAGAAALGRAYDFLRGHPDGHVLVVAVELPTLSFQRDDVSLAQLVSTAIFGDGAAAVLLKGRPPGGASILEVESHLFPDSLDAIGFELRDDGFHVLLAKDIPDRLRGGLLRVVDSVLRRADLVRSDLTSFVMHPGGRNILCALQETLGIPPRALQPSWDVLREYGNMSSAAVLVVLDRWFRKHRPAPGTFGLLGAFGPGLSMELCVLEWT
jgi:alkylresorcinol/alkylpyrone synthase